MNPDNQAFNLVAFLRQVEEILKWNQTDEKKVMQFKALSATYVATLPNDVIHYVHEWKRKLSGKTIQVTEPDEPKAEEPNQ